MISVSLATSPPALLGTGPNGTHLVRRKGNTDDRFILTVKYMNMPTHHMLGRCMYEWQVSHADPTGRLITVL